MQTLLAILQSTVPALVVFATVYYLMRLFFENERNIRAVQLRQAQTDVATPLKFQALERFALLCERIRLRSILSRIQTEGLDVRTTHLTIVIMIQQEFEHNIAQQIYISPELWQIIRMAKDQTTTAATYLYQAMPPDATIPQYLEAIYEYDSNQANSPLDTAQAAIKEEARQVM